jgi:hypothetical protein
MSIDVGDFEGKTNVLLKGDVPSLRKRLKDIGVINTKLVFQLDDQVLVDNNGGDVDGALQIMGILL